MQMKFRRIVGIAGCSAWMWTTSLGAPEEAAAPVKSLAELVEDLGDPKFRVREEASKAIWQRGEPALEELEKAAAGEDPERAFRAREIIRKVRLFITPDTDPEIVGLVERYEKASLNDKYELFSKMHRKRAWRQILKLYAGETNAQVQAQLLPSMPAIAVVAARECLAKDDTAGAREFLEMAPVTPAGLLALAEFHRQQGTLEAELERAKPLSGANGAAWRLALQRAAGNHEAARQAAIEAGQPGIAASMAILSGDPLPWLRLTNSSARGGNKFYADLAIKRWEGGLRPSDLAPLLKVASSRNQGDRNLAIGAVFLLGEPAAAESAYLQAEPLSAFDYFDALERVPEALQVLGLDPDHPDYAGWVKARLGGDREEPEAEDALGEEEEFTVDEKIQEVEKLANFMERRGLLSESFDAFSGPMETLAKKDERGFITFLGMLFGNGGKSGAPALAARLATQWAANDPVRWDDVVSSIAGGHDEIISLWEWLPDLDGAASPAERMEALLALCGMGADSKNLAKSWMEKAWKLLEETPPDQRAGMISRMTYLLAISPDAKGSLRLWQMVPEKGRREMDMYGGGHPRDLSAAGKWDEAARYYLDVIARISNMKADPQPEYHAYAAASLRRAGREEEAAEHDALVEKFALGRDAGIIAEGYAYGYDYGRAAKWWVRAMIQVDPEAEEFGTSLESYQRMLMNAERWKEAAAASEVMAGIYSSVDLVNGSPQASPLTARQFRFHSDLARALSRVKEDRAGAIEALAKCHRDYPTDGGIADDFFPGVRSAGLMKEHDEWFRTSWDRMMAVANRFPDSDNVANTSGWLASRARRNLDDAEELLNKALAHHPRESAYLDTMAEIQFAKGKRAKALEWSEEAVNASPQDFLLRRQYERFRVAPLPREGM